MFGEQKVALFGASCRAAAQAAKRAGLDKVYAWDEFLDADLAHVATVAPLAQWYQEQTEPIIDLRNCMVVLCGGMENKPQLIDRLTDLGAVAGTTGNSIRDLRSIQNWKQWAESSKIGWPATYGPFGSTSSELTKFSREVHGNRPWLIKPTCGAGGIHVRPLPTDHSMDPGDANQYRAVQWYTQEYIPGKSIGVTYCSDRQKTHMVGIARGIDAQELEAPLPFIYRGNIAAVSVPERAGESLEFFGSQVAKQTELRGLWQADFQLDSEGQLWLLEINPRWSASMELHETLQGYSWMKKHLELLRSPHAVLDNATEYRKASDGQIAKGIVYAPRDLVASAEQIRRLWQNRWEGTLGELQDSAFRVADIPEPIPTGLAIPEGTPIATVLCSSGQTEVSEAVLLGKIQHARCVLLDWLKNV